MLRQRDGDGRYSPVGHLIECPGLQSGFGFQHQVPMIVAWMIR